MSFYAKSYMFCFEHKSKMIKIKPSDASQHGALLDEAAYEAHCG